MTLDPVEAALNRVTAGLDEAEAREIRRWMSAALAEFDPHVVGPDDQAIEVEAALDVPAGERVAAARHYASQRSTFTLGRRSGELLRRFAAGEEVTDEATRLLADVSAALEWEQHSDIRRELGEYALESRFVLAGGSGPTTTRGAKIVGR